MKMILSGQLLPGSGLRVTASGGRESTKLGGTSASTETNNSQIKALELQVSLIINFSQAEEMTHLKEILEREDADKEPYHYDIQHPTADALKMRQVQVIDGYHIAEAEGLQQWAVSFQLAEVNSTAEKADSREVESETSSTVSADRLFAEGVLKILDDALELSEESNETV